MAAQRQRVLERKSSLAASVLSQSCDETEQLEVTFVDNELECLLEWLS